MQAYERLQGIQNYFKTQKRTNIFLNSKVFINSKVKMNIQNLKVFINSKIKILLKNKS